MKKANHPTDTILVRAYTDSEWDRCNFALIHCKESWFKRMRKRLEMVRPFAENMDFCSAAFYDTGVDFYHTEDEDIINLLEKDSPAYVELEKNEEERLVKPENRLNLYRLHVYPKGDFMYSAYGKHTNEEFWAESFTLEDIITDNHPSNKQ
ncbi:hypothetical protein [Prevotella sp. HUN102]|uniref:hypothetical protein n=1 Tax=Prevotella sp. HUN102 TaxID=1392486 RepID=UPI00048F73AB|nr:hypothetical protein [Prevotella sp. HUN102]